MMHTKKIISISGAIVIAGTSILSSVSALSTESSDGNITMSNRVSTQWQEMKESQMETNQERKDMNQKLKEGRTEMKQENKKNRQEFKKEVKEKKQEFKQHMQEEKRTLSEKLRGQLSMAIDKLSVEKLSKILANADKVVTKIESSTLTQEKKDRFLAQIKEIKTVIQDRIDALTGNISDGNILSEILSGVTPDSSNNTTTSTGATTNTGTTTVTQ